MRKSKRYPGVQQIEPGRYQIRAEFKCPKTGRPRSIVRVVKAASMQLAADQRDRLLEELLTQRAIDRVRLVDFADWWLSNRLPELQSSTASRYARELDNHIVPAFGDCFVDAITRDDLIAWRDRQNMKPFSTNSVLRTMKLMLRAARHRYRLPADPAEDVAGVPMPDDVEGTGKVLTAEELTKLLAAVRAEFPQWYPLIRLLAVTGMRWSEATTLKWSDIDLAAGALVIRRKQVGGIIGPPKTRKSRRQLPIEPDTIEVLKAHREDLVRRQAPGLSEGWCSRVRLAA